jgi:large-conductance mechanosensitive channel
MEMSFVSRNLWFQDFSTFLKDSNIFNIGLGFLIAQATMDTSKTFVSSIVMPLIQALRTLKAPKFHMGNFVAALITLLITLLVAFLLIKAFRLQAKPIQPVMVANSETRVV